MPRRSRSSGQAYCGVGAITEYTVLRAAATSSLRKIIASQRHGAGNAGDRIAADPDLALRATLDVDAAGPLQAGALRGEVARGQASGFDQPLRQAGVETAGHRVLGHPDRCGEGAHLELRA